VAGKRTPGGGRRVLLWDAPNKDMCLSEVIGERASPGTRPDMGAVITWLVDRCGPDDVLEAAVFANVARGFEGAMAGWVASLRHLGWAVFVKPKQHRRDDVDLEMARHLDRRFNQGRLREVVLASHDAKAFAEPLARLARAGVGVAVLGFRERAGFAADHPDLDFVDLEDVPGAFARPLPRTNLFDLPSTGRWFAPFVEVRPAPSEPSDEVEEEPAAAVDAGPGPDAEAAPQRADVVHLVIAAMEAVIGDGSPGLLLQHAGELHKGSFPGFSLEDAGFQSHTDLLDELLGTGEVAVVRTEAGALLLRPTVIDLTDAAAEPAPAPGASPASEGPVDTTAAPSVPGRDPDPGTGTGTDADAADAPGGPAPGADAGGADAGGTGASRDDAGGNEVGDNGVGVSAGGGPDPGPNPIYRVFGYRPPGSGAA
jgi:uncharacterized protein